MRLSKSIRAVAAILASLAVCGTAPAQSPWQQPASDLAAQIASILGHGAARLMIRNLSSLPVDEIPAIRKLLEQDLRARGVVANSAPNDTIIRVTLSERAHGFTWVGEVIRGDDTQVEIVQGALRHSETVAAAIQMQLRKERFVGPYELDSLSCFPDAKPALLAVAERRHGLVALKQGCLLALDRSPTGFSDGKGFYHLNSAPVEVRDPRGLLVANSDGDGFLVYLPGTACTGSFNPAEDPNRPPGEGWSLNCHSSDDPWPLTPMAEPVTPPSGPAPNPPPNPPPPVQTAPPAPQIRAFYNAARNYFTGVVSPGMGVELPPFYTAAVLPHAPGTVLLISTVDGKILLVANNKLTAVAGTSDWGSDFASINSGCGTGNQIIAAGAGDATPGNPPTDSLRAFQITGSDATPASALLAIDGTVTALWTVSDGRSVLAVIRNAQNQFEVDRVTALCN
ncbi:MAG: hypothetical protein ACLQHF_13845 [Terracidiphilus sp.]